MGSTEPCRVKIPIEDLIADTTVKVKTALDNNKPGEAKVYTEILSLLMLHCKPSVTPNVDMNKPFAEISNKYIPDVQVTRCPK